MAFKQYKKKPKASKKVYKKKPKAYKKAVINRSLVNVGKGFPKKMVMTHKYNEIIQHYSSAGAVSYYRFVCNGMFDPNYSGAGHQPYYFDQMSAIYNHYTVIGAKITLKIIPQAETQKAFGISLSQNDDAVQTATGLQNTAEQSNGKITLFAGNGTDRIAYMTDKWSAKKTFGGSILANDNLQGSSTANPTELTFWVIAVQALDLTTTTGAWIDVNIQYIAVWDELKDVASS